MFWLIISVACFFLLRNFLSKLEIKNYGEWQSFKAPLWVWGIAAFACLIPFLNVIGLILVEIFLIRDIRDAYPSTRFKEGKSHWMVKFLDFMNKEF